MDLQQLIARLQALIRWLSLKIRIFKKATSAPSRNLNIKHKPKAQNLPHQVDIIRRRYCVGYWKLYQRSEPPNKIKLLLQKLIPLPHGGMIQLCPCLTISTPALRHLVITVTVKKLRLGFGAGSYQHNLLC